MGLAKRALEDEWDRGWASVGEKWVCALHVEDPALADLIEANATSTTCSYCDCAADVPVAAAVDLLVERIAVGLRHEWGNADDEGVPWEQGYVGKTYDTYELVTEAIESPLNHSDLIDDVVGALPSQAWAQSDFFRLRHHERLEYGWERFSAVVKHERRYFFSDAPSESGAHDPDHVLPAEMLVDLGAAVLGAGLLRVLAAGETVFRVRADENKQTYSAAREIGTAPLHALKSSGRMAPAGVPMFYAAFDEETALAEARDANPKANAFSAGRFELRRPLLVVDLSTTPDVPSLFDEDLGRLRWAFIFLRFFAAAISEPYVRDDRIHIEYVPTQVVTEWLRHRFNAERPEPVMGVVYRSARHSPGVNVALFLDNSGACDPEEVPENDPALMMPSSTPVVDDE